MNRKSLVIFLLIASLLNTAFCSKKRKNGLKSKLKIEVQKRETNVTLPRTFSPKSASKLRTALEGYNRIKLTLCGIKLATMKKVVENTDPAGFEIIFAKKHDVLKKFTPGFKLLVEALKRKKRDTEVIIRFLWCNSGRHLSGFRKILKGPLEGNPFWSVRINGDKEVTFN